MINKILASILINGSILYIIVKYIPELNFQILPISAMNLEIIFLLGAIFWFFDEIVKRMVKVLVLPLMLLMSGVMTILINIGIFYIFSYTVNYIGLGIQVELGTFVQVFFLSLVVAISNLLLKKL